MQASKPHSYGNRDRSTAKYVPRNQNRGREGGRNGGRPHGNPVSNIRSYEDLQKVWRSVLIRNPNASVRDFTNEKRIQSFFSKEGGDLQSRFLKSADGMKSVIAHHKRDCEKAARTFRSQGYYPWADAWDRYGKNPEGPYPECTHQQLKDGMFRI